MTANDNVPRKLPDGKAFIHIWSDTKRLNKISYNLKARNWIKIHAIGCCSKQCTFLFRTYLNNAQVTLAMIYGMEYYFLSSILGHGIHNFDLICLLFNPLTFLESLIHASPYSVSY